MVASNKNLLTPVEAALIVNVTAPVVVAPGVTTVTLAVPAVAMLAAGTLALSEVTLTNVVVSAVPFQLIVEPLTKLLPVAVSVNVAPPAVAELGDTEDNTGAGAACTTNETAADVPTVGVVTVTGTVPAVAIFAAGTTAVNEVALTNVVVRAAPFQFITDVLVKLVPVAVRVKEAPPAVAADGDTEVNVGAFMVLL